MNMSIYVDLFMCTCLCKWESVKKKNVSSFIHTINSVDLELPLYIISVRLRYPLQTEVGRIWGI